MNECFLKPGYIYVSREECQIKTILGSCIAVCLWDEARGAGGMCHYVNPRHQGKPATARYGDVAVRHLIRMMIQHGSDKTKLKAHVIGGAAIGISNGIGGANDLVAREILRIHRIPILSHDAGGVQGRKLMFNTATGEVEIKPIVHAGTETEDASNPRFHYG